MLLIAKYEPPRQTTLDPPQCGLPCLHQRHACSRQIAQAHAVERQPPVERSVSRCFLNSQRCIFRSLRIPTGEEKGHSELLVDAVAPKVARADSHNLIEVLKGTRCVTCNGFDKGQDQESTRAVGIQFVCSSCIDQGVVSMLDLRCKGQKNRLLHVAHAVIAIRFDRPCISGGSPTRGPPDTMRGSPWTGRRVWHTPGSVKLTGRSRRVPASSQQPRVSVLSVLRLRRVIRPTLDRR